MHTIEQQSIITIKAFLTVFNEQYTLFAETENNLLQLAQTVEQLADNQYVEMANAIQAFARNYPPIRDKIRNLTTESMRGVGGSSPEEITPQNEQALRKQLVNIIRVNNNSVSSQNKPKNDSNSR